MRWILWGDSGKVPARVMTELERIVRCILDAKQT
jgi:hypothetical protein